MSYESYAEKLVGEIDHAAIMQALEEQRKEKARLAAVKIQIIFTDSEKKISNLLKELKQIRAKEKQIKESLDQLGKAHAYAKSGSSLEHVAPLIAIMGPSYSLSEDSFDAGAVVPDDYVFVPPKKA